MHLSKIVGMESWITIEVFIQDQSDRKVEYMWEDVMLCKPI